MADDQESDSEINFNVNNQRRNGDEIRGAIGDHIYGVRDSPYRHGPIPHIKPDAFTGEEDWDQYISYFEDCAELGQWSEKEKLLYLATSLKQQARLHYSSLPLHEKRSYETLIQRLEQRFGNKRQQTRWLSKMQNRTRGRHESIAAFGDDIRLHAQKAYVDLDPEAQEMLALQHFYKNISPEMRCRLMDNDCRSIREAVEVVERYEEVLGKTSREVGITHVRGATGSALRDGNLVQPSVPKPNTNDLEEIKDAIRKIENRLEKVEKRESFNGRERTCFSCGSNMHYFRKCPNRNKNIGKCAKNQENSKPSHL